MRRTDVWMGSQISQNAILKTSDMRVMARFGQEARPARVDARKKPKSEMKFVVGETKVGGEEVV